MSKTHDVENLAKEIRRLLIELENYFWEVYVENGFTHEVPNRYQQAILNDKEIWLFHGTRQLYYKICLFLEMKGLPIYLSSFISKFGIIIDEEEKLRADRAPLYIDSEPSMVIHDDFRDFLSGFPEFGDNRKTNTNKIKLILENTKSILAKTNVKPLSEKAIYTIVR